MYINTSAYRFSDICTQLWSFHVRLFNNQKPRKEVQIFFEERKIFSTKKKQKNLSPNIPKKNK